MPVRLLLLRKVMVKCGFIREPRRPASESATAALTAPAARHFCFPNLRPPNLEANTLGFLGASSPMSAFQGLIKISPAIIDIFRAVGFKPALSKKLALRLSGSGSRHLPHSVPKLKLGANGPARARAFWVRRAAVRMCAMASARRPARARTCAMESTRRRARARTCVPLPRPVLAVSSRRVRQAGAAGAGGR